MNGPDRDGHKKDPTPKFVLLLGIPRPSTVAGQAWRLVAVSACSTAVVAACVGAVVGLVLGLQYPPTLVFAIIEGSIIGGVPGFVLGSLVGAVLGLAHVVRARLA